MKKEIKQSPFVKKEMQPIVQEKAIAIIVSDWNPTITKKLLEGCLKIFKKKTNISISVSHVPGCFELAYAADRQICFYENYAAIICLGCVIKGETIHDKVISFTTAASLQKLSIDSDVPIIFGVITADTEEQAVERAGGKKGNKGEEAALTALAMIQYNEDYPILFDDFADMWDDEDEEYDDYDDDNKK